MKVTIDKSGCIGCGLCEGTCPAVFHIADDGLAEVHTQPTPADEAAVLEAHVPGRGADEAAHGVLFHVLRHVNTHQSIL